MERPTIKSIKRRLKPGQILLVGRGGLSGWAITSVTGGKVSHAALIDRSKGGIWIVVEAVRQGVVAHRLEHYLEDPHYRVLQIRDINPAKYPFALTALRRAACSAAWLRVGKGYDFAQMLGFLWPQQAQRFDSHNRLICSELVTWAWLEASEGLVDLAPDGVPHGLVSPQSLAETDDLIDVWSWEDGA